jgi:molybdopterin/thiamine biosynthesis adenylyltransferase
MNLKGGILSRILIVGLGGVGSHLTEPLIKFVNYNLQNYNFKENTNIIFIDGDVYEDKNNKRQLFHKFGNKALVQYDKYNANELYFNLEFDHYPQYITNENINLFIQENDYIFLCVDNHASRKMVSDYCKNNISNVVIISGGNDYTDGNIQIYVKKDGKEVTPNLTKYHPEIDNPDDKNPNDMSCQELSMSEPQLIFANMFVATLMCCAFYNIINENYKYAESYFDINLLSADGKIRS